MIATLTNNGISVIVKGTPYTISRESPHFSLAIKAWKNKSEDEFMEVYNSTISQAEAKKLGYKIVNGKLMEGDKEVHSLVASKIMEFIKLGLDHEPLLNFLNKCKDNPSPESVIELFDFLQNSNLPFDPDGDFYAYKVVDSKFWSKTKGKLTLLSGTSKNGYIYNAPGEIIECLRYEVDDKRTNTCSQGLHAGGLKYSGPNGTFYSNGDRIIIVKINPKDVIAVPKDYSCQKLRTCRYEVVSEYKHDLPNLTIDEKPTQICDWCGFGFVDGCCPVCVAEDLDDYDDDKWLEL